MARSARWIAVLLLLAPTLAAAERPAVLVTPGASRNFRAALQLFRDRSPGAGGQGGQRFREQIGTALEFSGVFEVLDPKAFLGPERSPGLEEGPAPVCADWKQIGADALVEGEINAAESFTVEFRVWDTARCRPLGRRSYSQPRSSDPGVLARRVADDIVAAFTGVRGVASTELAFISSRGGNPEVYVMAADGAEQRRATANGSINNFPAWSPAGDAVVYTSYRQQNRPLLFLSTRGRRSPGRMLSRLPGGRHEYRGVFAPDGRWLAVVLSAPGGDSEIFRVRPDGSDPKRLTRSRSIDVSPSWSPDGSKLAFVSDRAGSPQVYVMDADGGNARRLTYQGGYNTHPSWSPDGRWIAYESRVGGQFDIWLIDPAGEVSFPLVEHPRSDESPAWAPDGRKLAFSSRRRGRADIYVVGVDGQQLRRLTGGAGDNTSPAWGPWPR